MPSPTYTGISPRPLRQPFAPPAEVRGGSPGEAASMLPGQPRPAEASALDRLAIQCQQRGRDQEAVHLLGRAVQLTPAEPRLHADLGSMLGQLGRVEEALGCFRTALRLWPEYVHA